VQHVRNINQVTTINAPSRYLNQIHPDAVTYAPPRALPGRMRIQEVATRAPAQEVTRVSVQPRPPLAIDDQLSKRRLIPAGGAVAAVPATGAAQPLPQVQPARPMPNDFVRRPADNNARRESVPPGRATAPSQERIAPPMTRPPMVQEAPGARPEIAPPTSKRALAPNARDAQVPPSRPAPARAEPRAPQPVPQAVPAVPQVAPPVEPRQGAPSQRAQSAPPVVRQPPQVQADEPRGRGQDNDSRGRGGGPQRAAPRDR
jgi:hypothetical protein